MTVHGMNPCFCCKAHSTLAVRVPRHPKRDGPAEAAGRGKLETEVVVETCDGVVVLVDYKEVTAGRDMTVVEAMEGGRWERGWGEVGEVRGNLEVREGVALGALGGRVESVIKWTAWSLLVADSTQLPRFPPVGSWW